MWNHVNKGTFEKNKTLPLLMLYRRQSKHDCINGIWNMSLIDIWQKFHKTRLQVIWSFEALNSELPFSVRTYTTSNPLPNSSFVFEIYLYILYCMLPLHIWIRIAIFLLFVSKVYSKGKSSGQPEKWHKR